MTEPVSTFPGLAEGRWLWRRLYVYVASLGLWLGLDRLLARAPVDEAPDLARWLMMLLGLTMVLYLVAPSAQQLIALFAELRARAGGV